MPVAKNIDINNKGLSIEALTVQHGDKKISLQLNGIYVIPHREIY